jgi:hypothetical protein
MSEAEAVTPESPGGAPDTAGLAIYAGKREEGRARLAKSRTLNLTPSEKQEIEDFSNQKI